MTTIGDPLPMPLTCGHDTNADASLSETNTSERPA